MKLSIAKCVSDRASVHAGNDSSGTMFALEQDCCILLLKVEHPVSDRFLKQSRGSLNTFDAARIAMEPLTGKFKATTTEFRCDADRTSTV